MRVTERNYMAISKYWFLFNFHESACSFSQVFDYILISSLYEFDHEMAIAEALRVWQYNIIKLLLEYFALCLFDLI